MSTLGARLKKLRLDNKLTMERLATAFNSGFGLSVGKGSISRWENGTREPTLSYLTAYAMFFHVSLDYLVGVNTYLQKNTIKEKNK